MKTLKHCLNLHNHYKKTNKGWKSGVRRQKNPNWIVYLTGYFRLSAFAFSLFAPSVCKNPQIQTASQLSAN